MHDTFIEGVTVVKTLNLYAEEPQRVDPSVSF